MHTHTYEICYLNIFFRTIYTKYFNIVQYFAPYDFVSLKKIVFNAFSYNSKMINNIYFMYKL